MRWTSTVAAPGATATEVAEFPSSATSDRAGMAGGVDPRPAGVGERVPLSAAGLGPEQGARISGPDLDAFTATLNDLPRGLSRAVQLGMGTCREPGTLGSLDDDEMHADIDAYRIEVRYPDGPPGGADRQARRVPGSGHLQRGSDRPADR